LEIAKRLAAPESEFEPLTDESAEVARELEHLRELDLANRTPGVDLSKEACMIARTPSVRAWLEQSDVLVDEIPCHPRLRDRRRRGLLRHLRTEPAVEGLPFFGPPVPPQSLVQSGVVFRWAAYRDELELELVPTVDMPGGGWRPTFSVMNSFSVRSVLWVTASWFYRMNRAGLMDGKIGDSAKYETEVFMRWVFRWFRMR
jgi:hypothetical protein